MLYGRVPIKQATALLWFKKKSIVQQLLHNLKYKGHEDIGLFLGEWLGEEHPNFLEEKYLTSFSNTPVFIYHGRKDASLNVDLIEKMSKKLTKAGAIVTISIVEENGHEYPDENTNNLYFEWLNTTSNR